MAETVSLQIEQTTARLVPVKKHWGVVLFFALLVSYPWWVLSIGTVSFLLSLPFGWLSYREHQRKDAAAKQPALELRARTANEPAPAARPERPADPPERPARLN